MAGSATPDEPGGYALPQYNQVLVAVDGSKAARFALRHAVAGAVNRRWRLTLVTVVPHPPGFVSAGGVAPDALAAASAAAADKALRAAVAGLPDEISVTTLVRHGSPADEILALLREEPFDLVWMGARGRGRVASALLGSVSGAVMHHSPVPVIVVHPAPVALGDAP
jgi:nucleotide-binding universal stress UspA family protein